MEKYLIAVDLKDFDTCLDEAKSLQKILLSKGINTTWSARHKLECVELNTPNRTIELVTFRTLAHEGFTVGKRYDKVFYINPDANCNVNILFRKVLFSLVDMFKKEKNYGNISYCSWDSYS